MNCQQQLPGSTDCLSSEIFRISGKSMIIIMARRFAIVPLALTVLTAVASAALAAVTADIRFFVVTLMVVFIIAPMVMAWLYFFYGLRKECFVNVLPHRLHILTDGIRAEIFVADTTDSGNPSTPSFRQAGEYFFPASTLHPFYVGLESVTIPVGAVRPRGFIRIPASAFGGITGLSKAAVQLSVLIKKQQP